MKSLSPSKMIRSQPNLSIQGLYQTQSNKKGEPQPQNLIEYSLFIDGQEYSLSITDDSTVAKLTFHAKEIAEQLGIVNYEDIICLETVGENEVIDYYLTHPFKKAAGIQEGTLFRLVFSQKKQDKSKSPQISIFDFVFLKCLGKGGTSDVFLVRHKESGKLFALKMIPKTHLSEYKRLEQLLRERKVLIEASKAPFIANLHACFESDFHLNFLLEFYCGGELFFHLQSHKLTENEAKFYFVEILICFEYLHSNKILYRDLKPENIVLDMAGHVRLTDFGLSKIGMQSEEMTDSFCGSPEYMAPEVLLRQGYNYSVDFYTLGAFLFELVTGLPPYYANNTETILRNIQTQELEVPDYVNPDLSELLYSLLTKSPDLRIKTFDEIKQSQWFNDVNWKEIINLKVTPPIQIDINQSYIHSEFKEAQLPKISGQKTSQESLFSFFYYINPNSTKLFKNPHNLEIQVGRDDSSKNTNYSSKEDGSTRHKNQGHSHGASSSQIKDNFPVTSLSSHSIGNNSNLDKSNKKNPLLEQQQAQSQQFIIAMAIASASTQHKNIQHQTSFNSNNNNAHSPDLINMSGYFRSGMNSFAQNNNNNTFGDQINNNRINQQFQSKDGVQHSNNGSNYYFTNQNNLQNSLNPNNVSYGSGVYVNQIECPSSSRHNLPLKSGNIGCFSISGTSTTTSNVGSNSQFIQQFTSQKRTNTESSATRSYQNKDQNTASNAAKKSISQKPNMIGGGSLYNNMTHNNLSHPHPFAQTPSQQQQIKSSPNQNYGKFLDLDILKNGSSNFNLNPIKDKQVDSTSLIKSFLKGQMSYSTKSLKQAPQINNNQNILAQQLQQHVNHHQHSNSNGLLNTYNNNYQSSSSQDKKRYMSPCYSPKNYNVMMSTIDQKQRPITSSNANTKKKVSVEKRDDSLSLIQHLASTSLRNDNEEFQMTHNTSSFATKSAHFQGSSQAQIIHNQNIINRNQSYNQGSNNNNNISNTSNSLQQNINNNNNNNYVSPDNIPNPTNKENNYQMTSVLGKKKNSCGHMMGLTTNNAYAKNQNEQEIMHDDSQNHNQQLSQQSSQHTSNYNSNSTFNSMSQTLFPQPQQPSNGGNALQTSFSQSASKGFRFLLEEKQLQNRQNPNKSTIKKSSSKQKTNQNSRKSLDPSHKKLSMNDNLYTTKNNFIKYFEDITSQCKKPSLLSTSQNPKSSKILLKESQTPKKNNDCAISSINLNNSKRYNVNGNSQLN